MDLKHLEKYKEPTQLNGTDYYRFPSNKVEDILQKARQDWLREEIVKLEGMEEYIAVKDNDSHRYQIPRSKKEEWDTFCEIPEDDERSWDVPEWAERIDGMPVKSFKQTIIDRYQTELDQDKK